MKHKKIVNKRMITGLITASLAASFPIMAANYDVLKTPHDSFMSDKAEANKTKNSESVLDSLRRTQIDVRKDEYQSVLDLVKQNKIAEAQAKTSELLKKYPREAEFYNLQASFDLQNKDIVAAQKSYEQALLYNKDSILAHLGLAGLAADAEQFDVAKKHLNDVLMVNSNVPEAYVLLARIAAKQKDAVEVEKMLLDGYEKSKGGSVKIEGDMFGHLARFYSAQKKPEKILPLAENFSKRYPNNGNAVNLLAQAQLANNKKSEAYSTLQNFINTDKQDIGNRLFLAKLAMEDSNKEQEAFNLLDEAIKIAPGQPDPFILKAAYLVKLKRNAEAMALTDKIIAQFPNLVQGKLLKAELYVLDKKFDEALSTYRQIYKDVPDNSILFNIVDLLGQQNKLNEGIKLLDDVLVKNPKNLAVHFKLATLYQQQNENKQAEKHYKAILAEQADNVLALNNLAILYSTQNDPQAIDMAKKAYEKAPQAASVADTYGYILVKQGDPKEGLTLLEKAASLAPNISEIQFHLADAYATTGDTVKAIAVLETLVKSEENFKEKQVAIDLLAKLKAQ